MNEEAIESAFAIIDRLSISLKEKEDEARKVQKTNFELTMERNNLMKELQDKNRMIEELLEQIDLKKGV